MCDPAVFHPLSVFVFVYQTFRVPAGVCEKNAVQLCRQEKAHGRSLVDIYQGRCLRQQPHKFSSQLFQKHGGLTFGPYK